jgi:hypothetical protein
MRRYKAARAVFRQPHRWVIARTYAWLGRFWHLAIERKTTTARSAPIYRLTRLIASYC